MTVIPSSLGDCSCDENGGVVLAGIALFFVDVTKLKQAVHEVPGGKNVRFVFSKVFSLSVHVYSGEYSLAFSK